MDRVSSVMRIVTGSISERGHAVFFDCWGPSGSLATSQHRPFSINARNESEMLLVLTVEESGR